MMLLTPRQRTIDFTSTKSSLCISIRKHSKLRLELGTSVVFNLTHAGHHAAPSDEERGAFQYLTVVNLGSDKLSIDDLWLGSID
ncbi:hypothetical protein BD309DRAFT_383675 [Dichomitus squalens]|nr:hypothetical protein BD309DRAFT_383675 [Dichomitus squalens]